MSQFDKLLMNLMSVNKIMRFEEIRKILHQAEAVIKLFAKKAEIRSLYRSITRLNGYILKK